MPDQTLLGRITEAGSIYLGSLLLGRRQAGRTILRPDALEIAGVGSTGDASGLSATPNSAAAAGTLARLFGDRPGLGTTGPNWPSYTPTVTFSGGSSVTVTLLDAKYEQIGKSLKVRTTLQVSWANGGSSPSDVSITLPGGQLVRGLKGDVGTNLSASSPIFITGNNGAILTARQGYGGPLVAASGQIIGISWTGEVQ